MTRPPAHPMPCRPRCSGDRRCWPALVVLAVVGCSPTQRPPLGVVSGTVTLDGNPLPEALVSFTPQGPGRTSLGITGSDGRYALVYIRDVPGATVDQHTVRITTAGIDADRRERLPGHYHARTTLGARVFAGRNDIRFDLQSGGR